MVYLIYGAPCSGKSTYAKEHKKSGDIVCDVDRLFSAISLNEEHQTELYAQEVASMLYKELVEIIRDRRGNWKNAFVISLANTKEQVQRAKNQIKADECIFIDTPYEVCMERAKERPFYFNWLIQEWFATKEETINVESIDNKKQG